MITGKSGENGGGEKNWLPFWIGSFLAIGCVLALVKGNEHWPFWLRERRRRISIISSKIWFGWLGSGLWKKSRILVWANSIYSSFHAISLMGFTALDGALKQVLLFSCKGCTSISSFSCGIAFRKSCAAAKLSKFFTSIILLSWASCSVTHVLRF